MIPRLIDHATDDDLDMAANATYALGFHSTDAVRDSLIGAIDDGRLEVRIAAIGAFASGRFADAAAILVARLVRLSLPSDDQEFDEILIALRALADPQSEGALVDVLASSHAHERSHPLAGSHGNLAALALEAVGTPTASDAVGAWRQPSQPDNR